ncbi:unnamed protein product [Ostreobium quekettii]|uniref:Uncharacterized protein n=1 Tax=Ostreobium quekettii TaxID=121088 RepID=A0A8S1ILK7_9CHLO|nr:unnamed protein product [Ostreobium quekettii]
MVGSAVIVGVGPGLGAALARRFSKGGYPVALCARRMESLKPVKEAIEGEQGKAGCYAVDSTVASQVEAVIPQITSELGPPEVLCYNVGPSVGHVWPPPTVEETSLEKFRAGLEAGAVGAFLWSKQVIPSMKANKKGTILLTGATAALRGSANFCLLSPGKFAMRSLGQTMARELHPLGIHVAHVIVDGFIGSPIVVEKNPNKPREEFLDPQAMAEEYWKLHSQHPSTWSSEIDLRPFTEKF